MGVLNGGQPLLVPLIVTQEACSFPASKLGQLDPKLEVGMNIITVGIQT